MDLTLYIGKYVRIELANNFYYAGKVINADEDSLELIDKNNQNVSLKKEIILAIRECLNGKY